MGKGFQRWHGNCLGLVLLHRRNKMKEHFSSVNSVLKDHRDMNPLSMTLNNPANKKEQPEDLTQAVAREDEAFLLDPQEWYNSRMKQIDLYDNGDIDGMDFNNAMESANFIRNMAGTTEGRELMGQAHHTINPQSIIQLFGL